MELNSSFCCSPFLFLFFSLSLSLSPLLSDSLHRQKKEIKEDEEKRIIVLMTKK
jgi:hypothetical protein